MKPFRIRLWLLCSRSRLSLDIDTGTRFSLCICYQAVAEWVWLHWRLLGGDRLIMACSIQENNAIADQMAAAVRARLQVTYKKSSQDLVQPQPFKPLPQPAALEPQTPRTQTPQPQTPPRTPQPLLPTQAFQVDISGLREQILGMAISRSLFLHGHADVSSL